MSNKVKKQFIQSVLSVAGFFVLISFQNCARVQVQDLKDLSNNQQAIQEPVVVQPPPEHINLPIPNPELVIATPTPTPVVVATPTPVVAVATPTSTPVVVATPTPEVAVATPTPTPVVAVATPTPTPVVVATPAPQVQQAGNDDDDDLDSLCKGEFKEVRTFKSHRNEHGHIDGKAVGDKVKSHSELEDLVNKFVGALDKEGDDYKDYSIESDRAKQENDLGKAKAKLEETIGQACQAKDLEHNEKNEHKHNRIEKSEKSESDKKGESHKSHGSGH